MRTVDVHARRTPGPRRYDEEARAADRPIHVLLSSARSVFTVRPWRARACMSAEKRMAVLYGVGMSFAVPSGANSGGLDHLDAATNNQTTPMANRTVPSCVQSDAAPAAETNVPAAEDVKEQAKEASEAELAA